ncbi:paraquat-inducible protein A [Sulfurovum sp.]|uniref:paraquat-inducible protein A n=1 Tax=Sulfurovum sp. TaxID=1969726 RepID=UPI003565D5E8
MKKSIKIILYSVLSVILGCMVFFGVKAYDQAILYEKATTELVSYQDAGQQASLQLEKFAKSLLGDLYEDEQKINLDKIREKQTKAMLQAQENTIYFMVLLGVILILSLLGSLRTFTLFGSLSATVTLILGLITPILMVTIHKEVEYLGDIVLSFESKGVIGSIVKLYESGDIIVAIVILLFSVLVPGLKVLSLLFVSIFMESKFAHSIIKFFKMIGKWSMVDVFVVAVFLVYLTANKGDVSRAEVEVGLYFFLAYVIVSMFVSLSADKMLSANKSIY